MTAVDAFFTEEDLPTPFVPDLSDLNISLSLDGSFHDEKSNSAILEEDWSSSSFPASSNEELARNYGKNESSSENEREEYKDYNQQSEYELYRKKKIEENMEFLKKVGVNLLAGQSSLFFANFANSKKKKNNPENKKRKLESQDNSEPSRFSKRIRGEKAPSDQQLAADLEVAMKLERTARVIDPDRGNYSDTLWRGRPYKRSLLKLTEKQLPSTVIAPFTLGSIGTTIESAGTIKRGNDERLYWSSAGALHKHRYPVGYRATKEYFGKTYIMEIKEGRPGKGPVFEVREEGTENVFKGPSPTAPWTEVCVRSRSPGTRVSGPLFFGFSDPIAIKMIRQLEDPVEEN